MENGLQITSKKFEEISQIHLLEFIDSDKKLFIMGEYEGKIVSIIWDLYNTDKYKSTELDDFPVDKLKTLKTPLAGTSGNILQIKDDGTVSSVLKKVETKLQEKNKNVSLNIQLKEVDVSKLNEKPDKYHIILDNENIKDFKPIVSNKELWALSNYVRVSYCLYQETRGTETETLQLIVGRSTVQIWHQVRDDNNKSKEKLPNNGEPFLEYIWANRIPVSQEREKTKLRIEKFECDESHDKLKDFRLKVYWYERRYNKENTKTDDDAIDKEIDEIEENIKKINKNEVTFETQKQEIINNSKKVIRKEQIVKRRDIIEKFHAVRHACKALGHLNKRYKSNRLANNYIKIRKVSRFKLNFFFRNKIINISF
jgi:hypothetical protein